MEKTIDPTLPSPPNPALPHPDRPRQAAEAPEGSWDRDQYASAHGSEKTWPLLRRKLFSHGQQRWLLASLRRWCTRQMGVQLPNPGNDKPLWIGKDVYLDDIFPELITIHPGAVLGLRCMLICHDDAQRIVGKIEIGAGAFIGAGAIILPNVHIGAGAKIGAGAVVTKNIPAGALWAGVPARPLRHIEC